MNPNAKKPQRKVLCFVLRLLATVHVFCCCFSGIETLFGMSAISFMKVLVNYAIIAYLHELENNTVCCSQKR